MQKIPLQEFNLEDAVGVLTKIYERTERDGDCFLWQGAHNGGARGHYPYIRDHGCVVPVHRLVAKLTLGDVVGLDVDQTCANRSCIARNHLEVVPHRVNCQRMQDRRKAAS